MGFDEGTTQSASLKKPARSNAGEFLKKTESESLHLLGNSECFLPAPSCQIFRQRPISIDCFACQPFCAWFWFFQFQFASDLSSSSPAGDASFPEPLP